MRLEIYGSEGYLVFVDFELLLARIKKVVEFMIPTPRVPTVGAN
jgi:hypothetical protein